MMTRLRLWLDTLRTSLWFVPALLVAAAVALAYGVLAIDATLPVEWWRNAPWLDRLLDVRSTGASAMLQTIGGSIITIAGVVFSITIAALALASGQYTSRVLRNFIRDTTNQVVLGTFLGIFVYYLLIMRSLAGVSEVSRAPALAMLVALMLAFVGIGMLIYFIHHIATRPRHWKRRFAAAFHGRQSARHCWIGWRRCGTDPNTVRISTAPFGLSLSKPLHFKDGPSTGSEPAADARLNRFATNPDEICGLLAFADGAIITLAWPA